MPHFRSKNTKIIPGYQNIENTKMSETRSRCTESTVSKYRFGDIFGTPTRTGIKYHTSMKLAHRLYRNTVTLYYIRYITPTL